jgi:DNA polymerase-2
MAETRPLPSGKELPPGEPACFRGFLVHAYGDLRRDRLYLTGRLEDGRSFAAMESRWRPSLLVYERDRPRWGPLLASLPGRVQPSSLEDFFGRDRLLKLCFSSYGDRNTAARLLEKAGIPSPDGDGKPADAFLGEGFIRGPILIRGGFRPGSRVDLVFPDPELAPPDAGEEAPRPVLRIASIDIETDTHSGSLRAIGVSFSGSDFARPGGLVRVLAPGRSGPAEKAGFTQGLFLHPDEPSLIRAFIEDIGRGDPDVLTGWNFLDFDFPRLAARCAFYRIPFAVGRSSDGAKYFAGEGRRSAAAVVPGRQVVDALRIVRSGPKQFSGGLYVRGAEGDGPADYTLETVSRAVLGEGKTIASSGENKIAELDRLYREDPLGFGEYCYRDAELVLRILAQTGLFRLTLERASLTGVSLDKAWTSVVSFERIYGLELRRRGIAPPPVSPGVRVSGAAGGTVLDPLTGVFDNVAVFDFRSLYPSIMRTFNIDPLAHARQPQSTGGPSPGGAPAITAPNGAVFSRNPGVLPALITGYFASRRKALEGGDESAAHVYKILMNSFYGVLGTKACRYGRTELAGAITSFARKWLLLSRDWFTRKGFRVLYGDTDSLFVETGLGDGAAYGDFLARGEAQAGELNRFLAGEIRAEYGLESFLELRFEKAYRRFLIPPLRNLHDGGGARGRAKGYGGYLLHADGKVSVEVKGMEAVRSDATPLARRVQLELLELVFSGGGEEALKERVTDTLRQLRTGKLDGELVYRKRLSRPPETYTSSTPPQVKAARALGWKNRRGTVEYVWTTLGPEPASRSHGPADYDHYADSQVLPAARSIAAAAGWSTDLFPQKGRNRRDIEDGQMELDLL